MRYACLVLFSTLIIPVALIAQLPFTETAIPVRDGNTLLADVYIGDNTAAKPTILIQTPYNKNVFRVWMRFNTSFPLDTTHYHYVTVDWRGFYGSKNAAAVGYDRGLDGYDVIEWIRSQQWSNGSVAMWGGSALGAIQFLTARHNPPGLVCCVPFIIDYRTDYSDYYDNGVLRLEHVSALERLGFMTIDAITSRPVETLFWEAIKRASDYPESIAVPMLLCSGWFDHFPSDVLRAFRDLRERSAEKVRDQHKLIMGPWTHSDVDREMQGEMAFPNAVNTLRDATLMFFAYHLLGAKNGWPLLPALRYYLMGRNEWRSADSWDAIDTSPLKLHLRENGLLSTSPPVDQRTRSIVYDPRDPSPSHGGARFNPFDPSVLAGPLDISRVVEVRPDVLLYETEILKEAVDIAGRPSVTFTVESDRQDSDVSVRLCDVHPNGASMILSDGMYRLRFYRGTDTESLLPIGEKATVTIQLPHIAHSVLAGHRIRLVLGASNWPRYDRNLNNGGPMYTAGDTLVATNTLHHGPNSPGYLELPVLETALSTSSVAVDMNVASIRSIYPVPWRASASPLHIRVRTASTEAVLSIRDVTGRELRNIPVTAGQHDSTVYWNGSCTDGRIVPQGTYLVILRDGNSVSSRLLVMLH